MPLLNMRFLKNSAWKIYGSHESDVLIAGHSHAFSLQMALEKNIKYQTKFGVISQAHLEKAKLRDSSYWKYVAENSTNKTVVIVWNGNQHNIHFLVDTKSPFKVFGLIQGEEAYPAVSLARVRELFKPTFEEMLLVINEFFTETNLIFLGTPPPKSKEHLDKVIHLDPFFVELSRKYEIQLTDMRATSDLVRVAMWKLTQEMTKDLAIQVGAKFVGVPNKVIASNGLLKAEYWTDDLTHANEDFGALMLDEILRTIGSEE